MTTAKYDKTSPKSILQFARGLSGKSLSQVIEIDQIKENLQNRGDLGLLIEQYYFEHKPGPVSGPDFPEAGLELKTTGVLKKADGTYKPKERLVLKMIDFMTIVDEEFESSALLKKCKLMLIMFYLYEKNVPVVDRKFVLDPILFAIPEGDIEQIKSDWETIRDRVKAGKAHELSEGDTYYLGACRKGAGGTDEKLRKQPFSKTGAKSRAFSFKPNYMSLVIQGNNSESGELGTAKGVSIEEATMSRFKPYLGKSVEEISKKLNYPKTEGHHKGFNQNLCVRILSGGKSSVLELDKAGIEMKTIRIHPNGIPREAMSFPGFKFMDIINEEWEDSKFFEKIEKKFLFCVFEIGKDGIERLVKAAYWNMPYEDRLEARRVWEDTKTRVSIDATDLPKSGESHVAHVRPKGANGQDKIPTPQGGKHLKQCFWLNRSYIVEVLKTL